MFVGHTSAIRVQGFRARGGWDFGVHVSVVGFRVHVNFSCMNKANLYIARSVLALGFRHQISLEFTAG